MARCRKIHGAERWYPDKYDVKPRELIDPKLTPNENIWSFVYKVTCVWLTKARVFALTQEDMEELEQDVRLATYLRLRYVVVTKQYNKNYSFWVNCTRCCFSVCHACIERWLKLLNDKKNLLCGDDLVGDSDNSSTYFDTRSYCPPLITASEMPYRQKMDWKSYVRPLDRWNRLNEQADDEYLRHCENCLDLGVEPTDKKSFILANFTEEERKFMAETHGAVTPTAIYLRNWYARKKAEDPEWWARRAAKQKEYTAKYAKRLKERRKERRKNKSKRGSDDAT